MYKYCININNCLRSLGSIMKICLNMIPNSAFLIVLVLLIVLLTSVIGTMLLLKLGIVLNETLQVLINCVTNHKCVFSKHFSFLWLWVIHSEYLIGIRIKIIVVIIICLCNNHLLCSIQ